MTPIKDVITQTYGEEAWYALLKGQLLEYMARLLGQWDLVLNNKAPKDIALVAKIKACRLEVEELKQKLGGLYFTLKPFDAYPKLSEVSDG